MPLQDCTGNVHHAFCEGGTWIVGFDSVNTLLCGTLAFKAVIVLW